MARVCLLTPGQPSTDPRLVKEADALTEAGHEVAVLCGYWAPWAVETDRVLLPARRWTCRYVGGVPGAASYLWTRTRHALSRRLEDRGIVGKMAWRWSLCRVLPELERAAAGLSADLYIAHNLGALPAAVNAARRRGAAVGFDAEDLHSGGRAFGTPPSPSDAVLEDLERRYLPRCDFITASSDGIAAAYAARYAIAAPVTVLNVFPLAQRPTAHRQSPDGGPLTLCWFSQTIGPGRGLEDAVRTMGLLSDLDVELHLRGSWQDVYRDELLAVAGAAGVSPERIVSHPVAPPDEMVRAVAAYDVGLALEQPDCENRDVCLSNKIFTYLLAGNAVAATATSGQGAMMKEIGDAGFSYAPGDVEALARGLRHWSDDREALRRARRSAWQWGERRFNWEIEKGVWLDVVERVLARRKARVPA